MPLPKSAGLDLSLVEIKEAISTEKKKAPTFKKDVEKKFFEQVELEEEYLSNHKWTCPLNIDEAFKDRDTDMNPIEALTTSRNYFLDSSSLEKLACVAQNIVIFGGPNFRTGHNFIKRLITDVRLIGTPSADGFAMSATLYDKYRNFLVIKAPREIEDYTDESSDHELIVGKILNGLRSIIPNFAYVLGSFKCGPPIIKPGKKDEIITWCRSGEQVKYLMYENISNSISLSSYLKSCSEQDFMDMIVQLNYALMVAYKTHGFTHYDLHTENVLVREVEGYTDGMYIPYQGDFIFAKKIGTFIDYGRSHIYLPGTKKSLGMKCDLGPPCTVGFIHNGMYIDRPNPAMDSYRLLLASLFDLWADNPHVFKRVKGLIHYFHQEEDSLEDIFNFKDYSYLPYYGSTPQYTDKIRKFKYEDFIRYCREYCNLNDFTDPVISGRDYTSEIDEHIFIPNAKLRSHHSYELKNNIESVDELFDLLEPILLFQKYLDDNKELLGEYKFINNTKFITKIFKNIEAQISDIEELSNAEIHLLYSKISGLHNINYQKLTKGDVYVIKTPEVMNRYIKAMEETIQYIDLLDLIERKIEMLEYLNTTFNLDLEISDLKKKFKESDERHIILDFIEEDYNTLAKYLDSKSSHDRADKKLFMILDSLAAIIPSE